MVEDNHGETHEETDREVQFPPLLSVILVLLLTLPIALLVDRWVQQVMVDQERTRVGQQLEVYENSLTLALNRRLALLSGFKVYLESGNKLDHITDQVLDNYAHGLYAGTDGIRAVQVVRDGIITYTYPLKGNEQALNYNLVEDTRKKFREDFRLAMANRDSVLTGPVELVQGGQGLIARQAVLTPAREVWGLAAIVLDIPDILQEAGLMAQNDKLAIALQGRDGEIILGDAALFLLEPALKKVSLPGQTWTLAALPDEGWLAGKNRELLGYRFGAMVIIALLAMLVYLVARQQTRLSETVEVRTRNLEEVSGQLDYLQTHDHLTGLMKRREFERRLEFSLSTAKTDNAEHALFYLDINRLNVINDLCGHVAGNELLRQAARNLKNLVRKGDFVARMGGEEFAILMEYCPIDKAEKPARAVMRLYRNYKFTWDDKILSVSASVGLVPINAQSYSVDQLISSAHTVCHIAKQKTGTNFHVYDIQDNSVEALRDELRWVAEINKALEDDGFLLYFQTIATVKSQDVHSHYEVLVRMRADDGSIIPPSNFLPAAERYKLSGKLDRWVIQHTLTWLSDNPEALAKLNMCSINLSGPSFTDPETLKLIKRSLVKLSIPAHKICFEVTETAAIANLQRASEFIEELRAVGCQFALDDFGSGMSSFGYLKNLPVDYVKIDGSFVRNIVADPVDHAMVKSINEIAHVMGKRTIAEFVESMDILLSLREMGVDFAQGFDIATPQPLLPAPKKKKPRDA